MGTIAPAWWVLALLVGDGGGDGGGRDADRPPGWALTCTSASGSAPAVTTAREFAALALARGEALDPRIAATGFHATFEAELRIARAGRYRFTLESCGGAASLSVVGMPEKKLSRGSATQDVMTADVVAVGDWLDLDAGGSRLRVEFRRDGEAPARLRTLWEMEPKGNSGFGPEPIPESVASVPVELREKIERDLSAKRGTVLLEELSCVNCHAASGTAAALLERRPPIALERVAARARSEWLVRWIEDPQQLNRGGAMPSVLSGPDAKRDAAALVDLFEGLVAASVAGQVATSSPAGTPAQPPDDPGVDQLLVDRGRLLYHEVGCIACHGAFESPQTVFAEPAASNELPKGEAAVPFGDLAAKWRVDELAKFLLDPKSIRTHGRMPDFALTEPEAKAIAHYLATRFSASDSSAGRAAAVVADVAPATISSARIETGKRIFNERGCAACHTLGEGMGFQIPERTKPLAALDPSRGCLAATEAVRGGAPRYTLTAAQRDDLCAALEYVAHATVAAPADERARLVVEEFRCLSCHEKDERGGVAAGLRPWFRTLAEADLGDEGRLPPRLTGVGGRLRSDWIEEVVANGTRARPYLAARMPKFGADVAKCVANGVAALEGVWRSDSESGRACEPKADASLAADGRALVGKEELNCVTCHSFGDRPSAGTPGLDFQAMAKRIRGEFWRRYALAPLRFKPGTRMPVYFVNGKSEAELLERDAARQIDAIWAWFEHVKEMPAPEGVPSGQHLVLDVGDRPKVFRTFLERAGNRGIAVGFPQGLHFAFDAEQIRLVEAWTGEFLDVAPVWEGRGGHVAPELGPRVWSAPPGPMLLLAPREALRGETVDPKFARSAADWPVDGGRAHGVKFRGYRLEQGVWPTFLYELVDPTAPAGEPVQVEECVTPDGSHGIRFLRDFDVRGLKPDRLLMMRAPADAVFGVVVFKGQKVDVTPAKGEAHPPPTPPILFFRSDGTSEWMGLRYGVKE